MKRINQQNRLIIDLILHSPDDRENIGLMNGQMGHILVLTSYARKYETPWIENVADSMFENIIERIDHSSDISFKYGLAGIGWSIERLMQHGILPSDCNPLCEGIDNRIMRFDVRRIEDRGIMHGIRGLLLYVITRMKGARMRKLPLPFDRIFLSDWVSAFEKLAPELTENFIEFVNSDSLDFKGMDDFKLKDFINVKSYKSIRNLSLEDGLSGFIASRYLDEL